MTLSLGCVGFGFLCSNTTMSIPGVTGASPLDTGTTAWVVKNATLAGGTNTISYPVAMSLSSDHKSVTIAVGACTVCTNAAAGNSGSYVFVPASAITDVVGQNDTASITIPSFRIF